MPTAKICYYREPKLYLSAPSKVRHNGREGHALLH